MVRERCGEHKRMKLMSAILTSPVQFDPVGKKADLIPAGGEKLCRRNSTGRGTCMRVIIFGSFSPFTPEFFIPQQRLNRLATGSIVVGTVVPRIAALCSSRILHILSLERMFLSTRDDPRHAIRSG
jgi:hypothetical protein